MRIFEVTWKNFPRKLGNNSDFELCEEHQKKIDPLLRQQTGFLDSTSAKNMRSLPPRTSNSAFSPHLHSAQYHFTIFPYFAIEIKNKEQMYNFSKSSKSRMQRLEEPQFGHPYYSVSKTVGRHLNNFKMRYHHSSLDPRPQPIGVGAAVAYAENFHGGVSKCQNFSLH